MENLAELLLVPDKADEERNTLVAAWQKSGGKVLFIQKFWKKPNIDNKSRTTIYGNETFALVLAQILGKQLITVRDEVLAEIGEEWTKRKIELREVKDVINGVFPIFIKSVVPKVIKARIYHTKDELLLTVKDLMVNEIVITAEVLEIIKEVRVFVLDQEVCDLAYYEGSGDLKDPRDFAEQFLKASGQSLPKAYVIDLGYTPELGWFIIEFNSAWAAGLNRCNPENVLKCIRTATIN